MSKKLQTRLAAIAAFPLTVASTSSYAALPTGVADAIDAAQADMTTAIGLVIAAMVVVWGLVKLGRKLGWL